MHRIIVTLFGMTLLVAAGQVIAACSVSSSSTTPHLLELYTSEGCSSCPPAEQWYRGLRANDQIVPLNFLPPRVSPPHFEQRIGSLIRQSDDSNTRLSGEFNVQVSEGVCNFFDDALLLLDLSAELLPVTVKLL